MVDESGRLSPTALAFLVDSTMATAVTAGVMRRR
jgi:hypothetical protein